MLSGSYPNIKMLLLKSRDHRPGNIFPSRHCPIRVSLSKLASVSCSHLTSVSPGVVFCCSSPSVACSDKLFRIHLYYLKSVFQLSLNINKSFSCPISLVSKFWDIQTSWHLHQFLVQSHLNIPFLPTLLLSLNFRKLKLPSAHQQLANALWGLRTNWTAVTNEVAGDCLFLILC